MLWHKYTYYFIISCSCSYKTTKKEVNKDTKVLTPSGTNRATERIVCSLKSDVHVFLYR